MKNKKLASRNLLRRAENQARGTTQIAAKFLAAASDPDRSYPLTRANGRRLLAKRNVFGSSTRKGWVLWMSCCRFAPTTGSLKAVCPTVFVIVFADLNLPHSFITDAAVCQDPVKNLSILAVISPSSRAWFYRICSAVFAVSIPAAPSSPSSRVASSRILYLRILPAAFIGKASVKRMYFGTLWRARLALI